MKRQNTRTPAGRAATRSAVGQLLLAGASTVIAFGCTSSVDPTSLLPSDFPHYRVDEYASGLVLENGTNAAEMKRLVVETINAMGPAELADEPPNARFQARAKLYETTHWPVALLTFFPGLMVGAFAWLPCGSVDVDFDLEIEIDGERYRGRGVVSSPKYAFASASDRWIISAVRAATREAFTQAAIGGPVE